MVTQNSSALTQLTGMTECCICLKMFTDPRMLSCIHTFCFQCLKEMVDKSDKKPGDEIKCPMCRQKFTIPNNGVQGIQKNFFVAGMIEAKNTLNKTNMQAVPCDACKANAGGTESDISEATLRCMDCQEYLCEDCYKMHKAFKMSRNHKVLKIGGGEEESIKSFNVMNCDIHRGKVLDYYCADCKKVVCVSCFVESHKAHDCKDVNTVEEEFRHMINNSAERISSLAGELLANKEKSESKEDFLTKVAEREKAILQRSNELREMINEHAKSLLNSLDRIKNRRLKEIQAREDELDRNLIIVESFKRYCNELISKGSASDVCRSKDELLRRADELEEDHEICIMRQRVTYDLTFLATDLTKFLKATNENMIGSLKDTYLDAFAVMLTSNGPEFSAHRINLLCQSDNVSTMKDVPTTVRSFPAAAVYNNTMFIIGIGEWFRDIWKYNFASGWSKGGSLVQGRQHHCAEFLGETLYICGGFTPMFPSFLYLSGNGVLTNHVEAYNAVTEESSGIGQLSIGVKWAACAAYKSSIYVFGGLDQGRKWLNCVQVFNPVEQTCTLLSTPIPCPLANIRALSWNAYAILLNSNTCFIFDFDSRTWEERKQLQMGAGSADFGIVLENERIFIIDVSSLKAEMNDGQHKCDIQYIKASSILKDEAPKWRRPYGQLHPPCNVIAIPKMTLVK